MGAAEKRHEMVVQLSVEELQTLIREGVRAELGALTGRDVKPANEIVSAADAAEILHCSERHVRNLASSGRIPSKRTGKLYRFERSKLLAWVEQHGKVR